MTRSTLRRLLMKWIKRRLRCYILKQWGNYIFHKLDCNIYIKNAKAGQRVLDSITKYLMRTLKLKVNETGPRMRLADYTYKTMDRQE